MLVSVFALKVVCAHMCFMILPRHHGPTWVGHVMTWKNHVGCGLLMVGCNVLLLPPYLLVFQYLFAVEVLVVLCICVFVSVAIVFSGGCAGTVTGLEMWPHQSTLWLISIIFSPYQLFCVGRELSRFLAKIDNLELLFSSLSLHMDAFWTY